jgi:hypothetical protein
MKGKTRKCEKRNLEIPTNKSTKELKQYNIRREREILVF